MAGVSQTQPPIHWRPGHIAPSPTCRERSTIFRQRNIERIKRFSRALQIVSLGFHRHIIQKIERRQHDGAGSAGASIWIQSRRTGGRGVGKILHLCAALLTGIFIVYSYC